GRPPGRLALRDPLDVRRHVTYLLASCLLAAAMAFPPAGSRSPGSRGRTPAQSPPASPRGPCAANIRQFSANTTEQVKGPTLAGHPRGAPIQKRGDNHKEHQDHEGKPKILDSNPAPRRERTFIHLSLILCDLRALCG